MYYMIYINNGLSGLNQPMKFYARCNLNPEYEDKPIVWTEKVSEALVSENRKYIMEVYEKVKAESPGRHLDVLARFC